MPAWGLSMGDVVCPPLAKICCWVVGKAEANQLVVSFLSGKMLECGSGFSTLKHLMAPVILSLPSPCSFDARFDLLSVFEGSTASKYSGS